MAVKFYNIRSGETQVADTEPKIAAMWASSDHSPNVSQGQDMGWRMAPEVVVEMKRIKQDMATLQLIGSRMMKPYEDVTEPDILTYISSFTNVEDAPVADTNDYEDVYDQEIRRLSRKAAVDTEETVTTTTEETIEQLEARLKAKKLAEGVKDTTTTTTIAKVK